jgi:hypothetical protein
MRYIRMPALRSGMDSCSWRIAVLRAVAARGYGGYGWGGSIATELSATLCFSGFPRERFGEL